MSEFLWTLFNWYLDRNIIRLIINDSLSNALKSHDESVECYAIIFGNSNREHLSSFLFQVKADLNGNDETKSGKF